MRPHVQHLDSEKLPWVPIFKTGATRRTLNTDPGDTSFTSIVSIPQGWRGPSGAHYHSSFEEAYVVTGSLTLDGIDYLRAGSYLYRPGFIIHGWDERSDEGSLIVIKRGGVSDIISVGPRTQDQEYVFKPVVDGRPHIVHLKTADGPWQMRDGVEIKVLSRDDKTGAETILARWPAAWRGSFGARPSHDLECVVVAGGFHLADGTRFKCWDYFYRPMASTDPPITESPEGCTAILWTERRNA
ncbi:MAG: DUF4437 domain-containing protein [Alphaproteobacteria bacterium]|nr:DUF4437 domain-containing protein [Alphaproteobacteria bacterium]